MDKGKAAFIVNKCMMANDAFSQWLGIQVLDVEPGKVKLQMVVREEMLNGFGIAHGAITYALADSALAFASNGYGRQCVSIQTDIKHIKPVLSGDVLTAHAAQDNLSNSFGHYKITVKRGDELVALFQGMVYRTSKEWQID